MDEKQIRKIIQEELKELMTAERYTFQKHLQIFNGRNIILGRGVGTMIGTEGDTTGQKLGFFGATPILQTSPDVEFSGFSAGGGTTVDHQGTFTGNVGSQTYTIGDIVKKLKQLGLFKS